MKKIGKNKLDLYNVGNAIICLSAIFGLYTLSITASIAQEAKNVAVNPDMLSKELISWLRTGMSVVFILTLLFGAHNMWLHNKFTGWKEQTIAIIKTEFDPKLKEVKDNMVDKKQWDNWQQIQASQLKVQEQVLLRIEDRTRGIEEKVDEARDKLQNRLDDVVQEISKFKI